MNGLFDGTTGMRLRQVILVAAVLVVVFLAVESVSVIQGWRYIGAGINASDTITVSGHGEEVAVPDIATFTFSVVSDKPTVAAAQSDATDKINAVTAYLTGAGIDSKDIQTTDYSVNPQYEYQNAVCPQPAVYNSSSGASASSAVYCPGGKSVLTGYEVRQTTTVKVRDTSKAGDLLTGVGSKGATEVSGLNFTFDNPDQVQDAARSKAIDDAKDKAQALAKELGVHLVRIVSYSESGNGATPIYYKALDMAAGSTAAAPQASPEISVGQNKVTSDVSVTYEIR
ncbi:MAG TPA: SIMPL domain-containing protein [Candidatus Paceibacterota bacterium]|nr:SIMPL domain-containing protein [Candidatus Paceibacterota bacterium]